ncbi:MAG: hypothetical protein K9N06_12670 [Candidatus Cloacimonetes bacterium]|nr:hypothetical protein [Candidatus Cloacimonadota bacterium]
MKIKPFFFIMGILLVNSFIFAEHINIEVGNEVAVNKLNQLGMSENYSILKPAKSYSTHVITEKILELYYTICYYTKAEKW